MFKEQDKEDMKQEIKSQLFKSFYIPEMNDYETISQYKTNIQYAIENYVHEVVGVAVDQIIDKLYTHEDFERDIGLR